MSLSLNKIQTLVSEYNNFKNSIFNANSSLNNVISLGTIIYNNTDFATQFPNSWAAYQAYLVNLQTLINNFIASVPVEPSLNG